MSVFTEEDRHEMQLEEKIDRVLSEMAERKKLYNNKKRIRRLWFESIMIYTIFIIAIRAISLNNKEENSFSSRIEQDIDDVIKDFKLDSSNVKDTKNIKLGTLFEMYLDIDLDDDKIKELDKLSSLAKLKYYIDNGGSISLNDQDSAVSQSYNYLKHNIFDNNTDINRKKYKMSFSFDDGDCKLFMDKDYLVEDELLKRYIRDYEDYRSKNYDSLDSIVDSTLKMAVCDVVLSDGVFKDVVELKYPEECKPLQEPKEKVKSSGVYKL